MTLFDIDRGIAEAIEKLFDSVDPETGEIEPGSAEELEALQEARAAKLDGCGAYIKNMEAEAEAIKAEADKLKKRADQKKKNAERLKEYVKQSLQASGETRFETARVVFSFRSSEQVNITDLEKIPEEYKVTKTEVQADKAAIKKALKSGAEIEGAALVQNQNLQVK